jgi:iron complex outermembrane receptor protein
MATNCFGTGVGQPIIRGQGAPRILVLDNSLPVADASSTSNDHANAVEPLLAERLEVLRGPATLLYGSGAIGGVVNVIDRRVPGTVPGGLNGALELRHGSNADSDTAVFRLDGGAESWAWHVDGLYRENNRVEIDGNSASDGDGSSGFIENSNARAKQFAGGLSRVWENGFLGMAVSRLENNYGVPPGAHGHEEHEEDEEGDEEESVRLDVEQTSYDLRGELNQPLPGLENLRAYLRYSDYEHKEIEGGQTGTVFENQSWEGRLEATMPVGEHSHGAIGIQGRTRDFSAIGEEAFVPGSDTKSFGMFVVLDIHASDTATYELGARLNYDDFETDNGEQQDFTTSSLSASGLWQLAEGHSIMASLSRSERAPVMEELYSEGVHVATSSYELGDDSLEEETSLNLDVGYRYQDENTELLVNFYYNSITDYIYQRNTGDVFNEDLEVVEPVCTAPDADECLPVLQWQAADADFYGVEAELTIQLSDTWQLQLFGDHVRAAFDSNALGDVPRLPPARYGFEMSRQLDRWDARLRVTRAEEQDRPGNNEPRTDGYVDVGLTVNYRLPTPRMDVVLFLKGSNLLDREIRNSTSLLRDIAPEPGRNIEVGIRARF